MLFRLSANNMLRIRYPNSFLKLLLIGFALAILPLLWAFINANIAFGELAAESQATMANAVETTRLSQELEEKASLMERSARQYFVLKDALLFENYLQASTSFNESIASLQQYINKPTLQDKLQQLKQQTDKLHLAILTSKDSPVDDLTFLDAFRRINIDIEKIIVSNNHAIDETAKLFKEKAKKTQKHLFLESLILIPLALLVAAVITFLLARPIRRMDRAINNLGQGHYDDTISIDGPGDLRVLGNRLDWLRTELKDLNDKKQQFLRHVSHELKTPLTAIREATELLHDRIGGELSEQQDVLVQITRDNSVRLQKMIENLLNYTKVGTSGKQITLKQLDLSALIKKVLDAHALTITNKELVINLDLNIGNKMYSNEEKLFIIIDNLLSNAVNYIPNTGQINIKTKIEHDWFTIEMMDNGPGLNEADAEKVFDPFYRGETVNNGLINGSGLGLTIVKDVVESLNGHINLIASDTGAHFKVRLPHGKTKTMEI